MVAARSDRWSFDALRFILQWSLYLFGRRSRIQRDNAQSRYGVYNRSGGDHQWRSLQKSPVENSNVERRMFDSKRNFSLRFLFFTLLFFSSTQFSSFSLWTTDTKRAEQNETSRNYSNEEKSKKRRTNGAQRNEDTETDLTNKTRRKYRLFAQSKHSNNHCSANQFQSEEKLIQKSTFFMKISFCWEKSKIHRWRKKFFSQICSMSSARNVSSARNFLNRCNNLRFTLLGRKQNWNAETYRHFRSRSSFLIFSTNFLF